VHCKTWYSKKKTQPSKIVIKVMPNLPLWF